MSEPEPTPATPEEPRSQEGAIAESSLLTTVGLVAGVLGLTALANGAVLYAIDPGSVAISAVDAVFGVSALVFYALSNRASLARMASGRSTAMLAAEVILTAGVVAALIGANYFASQSTVDWDLTQDRLFTLQQQSIRTASELKSKVKVIGLYKPADNGRVALKQLFELYQQYTRNLELELINPDSAPPSLIRKYNLSSSSGRIVVATETRQTKIKGPSEEELTNALIRVAERPPQKVYFLEGHGEGRLDDEKTDLGYHRAKQGAEDSGWDVAALSLVDKEQVPSDATVLVLPGPRSPLFPNEVAAIMKYLDAGGRALVLLEPGTDSGLERYLAECGVEIGDNLVVDPNPASRSLGFGPDAPVITSYEQHPITEPLRQRGAALLFYWARSIGPLVGRSGVSVSTLILSSPSSWGESKFRQGGDVARDEEDMPGPVPLAVAATRNTVATLGKLSDQARLVVVGDSSFATNKFFPMSGNGDFFLNAVAWLIGDESRISIRPHGRAGTRLVLTEAQQLGIIFFSVNLLPMLIVGVGFSVWTLRRRK
jgi:ABC-type uncharacterized transport system involved in gliding motility auxiliary subunit